MKSDKMPRQININAYKDIISTKIGQEIDIVVNPNGHAEKKVTGIINFASSSLFGVKVPTEKGEYVMSFSYVDIFTGKVKVDL